MEDKEWDKVVHDLLDFSSIKSDLSEVATGLKLLNARLAEMEKNYAALLKILSEQAQKKPEQPVVVARADARPAPSAFSVSSLRGKARDILSLFVNEGFFTYDHLASRLGVSQSRVRAYIAEMKRYHNVRVSVVKDAEGTKIGLDPEQVNQILMQSKT